MNPNNWKARFSVGDVFTLEGIDFVVVAIAVFMFGLVVACLLSIVGMP